MNKFKKKWQITSNGQLLLILVVFSVTGSAALVIRKMVFNWIGITPETSLWVKIPLFILVLFPAYQMMLLVIGSLVGQFRFFYDFQKKSLGFLCKKRRS